MRTLATAVFVFLSLGTARADSPVLISDQQNRLTGLKDPAVAVLAFPGISPAPEPYLLLGDYGRNRLRAFHMVDFQSREELILNLPRLRHGYQRWAPCALVRGDTIWLYYTMGNVEKGIDWPSFRIYVAKGRVPFSSPVREINFTEEREIDLLSSGVFAGATDFGIIDPEIFQDADGQLYIYYNVVLTGIPGVRNRSSPIRSQRMHDPLTPYGEDDDRPVWDGIDGEDGVCEAPAVSHLGSHYRLIYSARGSDRDQCMVELLSDKPHGAPWNNRRILSSTRVDDKPAHVANAPWERLGVGGQCVFEQDGKTYLLYQGLGTLTQKESARATRFRAAVMELPARE